MDDAVHSSTQPRPVVVMTATKERSRAPVRSSSATAASAVASIDRPPDNPAYTRVGSFAGAPVAAAISAARGPSATNAWPLRPSDVHDSMDAGLPDRSGESGRLRPAGAVALTRLARSAVNSRNPWSTTRLLTDHSSDPTSTRDIGEHAEPVSVGGSDAAGEGLEVPGPRDEAGRDAGLIVGGLLAFRALPPFNIALGLAVVALGIWLVRDAAQTPRRDQGVLHATSHEPARRSLPGGAELLDHAQRVRRTTSATLALFRTDVPAGEGALVDRERLLLWVDRVAAGRYAGHRIDEADRTDPRTRAAFTRVSWLLLAEFVIGAAAVVEAIVLTRAGDDVSPIVWWRLLVIFGIATTLFYFVWRARLGYWWAYSRLRLFSLVFPVVAISTCLIPGLYPRWMVDEQLVFSAVLLLVRRQLSTPFLRTAYAKPALRPS